MSPPGRRSGPAGNGAATVRAATKRDRRIQRTPDPLTILDASTGTSIAARSARQLLAHLATEAADDLARAGLDHLDRAEVVSRWLAGLGVDAAYWMLTGEGSPPEGGGAA